MSRIRRGGSKLDKLAGRDNGKFQYLRPVGRLQLNKGIIEDSKGRGQN